jgi:hypothetical protein
MQLYHDQYFYATAKTPGAPANLLMTNGIEI